MLTQAGISLLLANSTFVISHDAVEVFLKVYQFLLPRRSILLQETDPTEAGIIDLPIVELQLNLVIHLEGDSD